MSALYIATGYLDGATLAAKVAADLPAHGLRLVEGGDWWAWPTLPRESDYMEMLRARTILKRQDHAIDTAGNVLVLLTPNCATGTGAEMRRAAENGLRLFWMDCGWQAGREIPLWLQAYGRKVDTLAELATVIGEATP